MNPPSTQLQSRIAPVRTIILHYHIFKNAGTSVDEILRRNFGNTWAEQEFQGAGARRSNVEAVAEYLRQHPKLVALSSHTALLPIPKIDGAQVIPILFVRHPIDRLRSAYEFERTQQADTKGAKLAKSQSFAGYLQELFKMPRNRQVRNFQTLRLSFNEPGDEKTERERAIRAVEQLPFVGLVEAYNASIGCLETVVRSIHPDFRAVLVHKNATRHRQSFLQDRLASIESELGRDFFSEVWAANATDLELYELMKARYASE